MSKIPPHHACPKCDSKNIRTRINGKGVGFVECGDCFSYTNSKYGPVVVDE